MNLRAYDKALKAIRMLCLELPEAREVGAWDHPTFRAGKKMFAGFGEHEGRLVLGLKVEHPRQDELLSDARFFPTPYAARQGWVSLYVDDRTDWSEVGSLIRQAYRQAALQRMLKELDSEA